MHARGISLGKVGGGQQAAGTAERLENKDSLVNNFITGDSDRNHPRFTRVLPRLHPKLMHLHGPAEGWVSRKVVPSRRQGACCPTAGFGLGMLTVA